MSQSFDTVTIIGVGLLGGSLGLALKSKGLARRIVGVGRRQSSLDAAMACGAIDEALTDGGDVYGESDLIVIATPAAQVAGFLDAMRGRVAAEAIVTDVASTKGVICEHAAATWPSPRRFVGSHPMAGSEKWGPEHADAALFSGAVCFVERSAGVAADARSRVAALWEALGSRVVDIDPAEHDALVARTSHIPHVTAAALAQLAPSHPALSAFIGKGFKDTTRVAAGRPELWRDICLTNQEAVAEGLRELSDRLAAFQDALAAGSAKDLDAFFEAGLSARDQAVDE